MTKSQRYWAWGIGIAVVLFIAGLAYNYSSNYQPVGDPNVVRATDHYIGADPSKAKLIVFEYADLQCPACALYAPGVTNAAEKFKDEVTFVFRHFPLPMHQHAWNAAYAAEAAGEQGKFSEMEEILFQRQREWSSLSNAKDKFREYAEDLGLDIDKYDADFGSDAAKERIKQDIRTAVLLGVDSTPSFYVNGAKVDNPPANNPVPGFEAIVLGKLTEAKAKLGE